MPLDERDAARLRDMLDACDELLEITHGEDEQSFMTDKRLIRAVERLVFLIGEAATGVSEPMQREFDEIPWRKIIGQRNVLAHQYHKIELRNLWSVVAVHVPELRLQLEAISTRYRAIHRAKSDQD